MKHRYSIAEPKPERGRRPDAARQQRDAKEQYARVSQKNDDAGK
jgi:hypothetical protein